MTTALLLLAMNGTATAATYTPTTFSDDAGAGFTLREAIAEANSTPDDDTVVLAAGTYELDETLPDLDVQGSSGRLLIRGAGARATTIDANGNDEDFNRVLTFSAGARADVQDVALTGGFVGEGVGGAVYVEGWDGNDAEVTFTRVAIHGNEVDFGSGGAIFNEGDVTLVESLVTGNQARFEGGGIGNADELRLVNSTVSSNESRGGNGGGISNSGSASETNGGGQGLAEEAPAESAGVFVENSTITANEALDGNGGGVYTGGGEGGGTFLWATTPQPVALAVFHNSIVAENRAQGEDNCSGNEPSTSDWSSSNGYNLENGETCEFKSTGDKDANPALGSLANNGGPTDTHALAEWSPAIDAGDPDANRCEDIDQRGVTRFQRNGCDMGAYEAGEFPQPPNEIPTTQHQLQPQETPRGDDCADRLPPVTTLRASGLTVDSNKVVLVGRSRDRGDPCPSGVERVEVSMAKVSGTDLNCRFVRSANRFVITPFRNCRRPILFRATGTTSWKFTFRGVLPRGKYRAQARGYDEAHNKETPKKRRNIIVFDVP